MDAYELVEDFFSQWLEILESGDTQEELPGFCQREADDALDVTRVADTCGGTEEEMGGQRAACLPARQVTSGQGRAQFDCDTAAVRVSEKGVRAFDMFMDVFCDPCDVILIGPGVARLWGFPKTGEIRCQDHYIRAFESPAELIE